MSSRTTVCGLGNRKNQAFLQSVAESGIDAYRSTLDLIDRLRARGVGVALITSSRNAIPVLTRPTSTQGSSTMSSTAPRRPDSVCQANLTRPSSSKRRPGWGWGRKTVSWSRTPSPGCRRVGPGDFGGVVGVDRGANREGLETAGADAVVEDLGEVTVG